MSRNRKVWIPAILAALVAFLLVVYYYYTISTRGGGEFRPPGGGGGKLPAGELRHPPGEGNGHFSTLGTIALFFGAAGFSWFWFKKKLKSNSILVRRAGKLLFTMHKQLGWITVILITIHGAYFLIIKLHDDKIYTGLAGFAILLMLVGYGYFINRVRNKWMRTVHRSLGLLWFPVLLIHAGGSAIIAVISALAVGGAVLFLERMAGREGKSIQDQG